MTTLPTRPVELPRFRAFANELPQEQVGGAAAGAQQQPLSWTRADRIGIAVTIVTAAGVLLSHLDANGLGNDFYAAAAWAGSQDWTALLYGSVDPGNVVTIDKPPLSQWILGTSVRALGLTPLALSLPQALMGIAAAVLVWRIVRTVASAGAATVAGVAMVFLPVVAMMFRLDDPDAVTTLLMVAGLACTLRGVRRDSPAWMAVAGASVGLAVLSKTAAGLFHLPALAIVLALHAGPSAARRARLLAVSGVASVLSSGWYVVLTTITRGHRPFIGGSGDDTFLGLALGYNGLHRLDGAGKAVSVPGLSRLFQGELSIEISWLLPVAAIGFVATIMARRDADAQDPARTLVLAAAAWLAVEGFVLSYMSGPFHAYYSLSLAPPAAILVGGGWHAIGTLWHADTTRRVARALCGAWCVVSGGWALVVVLRHEPGWMPGLAAAVAVLAASGTVAALRDVRRAAVLAAAVVPILTPAAYTLAGVPLSHVGTNPSVNPRPTSCATRGTCSIVPASILALARGGTRWTVATPFSGDAASLELASRTPVMAIGGFTGSDPAPTLDAFRTAVAAHTIGWYVGPSPGRTLRGASARIDRWVRVHFATRVIDGRTVADLRAVPIVLLDRDAAPASPALAGPGSAPVSPPPTATAPGSAPVSPPPTSMQAPS